MVGYLGVVVGVVVVAWALYKTMGESFRDIEELKSKCQEFSDFCSDRDRRGFFRGFNSSWKCQSAVRTGNVLSKMGMESMSKKAWCVRLSKGMSYSGSAVVVGKGFTESTK